MRRRATYIYGPEYSFNPADLTFQNRQIHHPGLTAAREERLTFALDDLPPELNVVLRQSHELHIRWVSERPYEAATPYLSSLTSGLHVHYTPLNERAQYRSSLCHLLQKLFSEDLKCFTPAVSFTRPSLLSERFANSAALQYYSILPDPSSLVYYLEQNVCSRAEQGTACSESVSLLSAADYIDLDYDSISHTLIMTAFWSVSPSAIVEKTQAYKFTNTWPIDIASKVNDKVEVGFLAASKADDVHSLKLGGFLAVVGEDEAAKPTLFSFPSRHHRLSAGEAQAQTFNAHFQKPTGLHPILTVSFSTASSLTPPQSKPEDSVCALHAYLTLPSGIFVDQYALPTSDPDPLFQQANNIVSLRAISGELDLEAPDYVIDKWGSAVLLELATPDLNSAQTKSSSPWEVTVPMHLRYQPPSNESQYDIQMPWPSIFWACTAEEGTKFSTNPFDRTNLGYDGLFGSRTMFYHVNPASDVMGLAETISVPVLKTQRVGGDGFVELGTIVVVLLGFGWVMLKMWPGIVHQVTQRGASTARDDSDEKSRKGRIAKKSQ